MHRDPKLQRATLPNGLRVLAEQHAGSSRTAVCVHYGVGYRAEAPGQEGFAHLFEHLMFRGSENLPRGSFFTHVHQMGGRANGTTHQDYTDYHQILPASALEQALFSEADRMRAPSFTTEALAEQLDGIEGEIHAAVTARPYGGLPWPVLPGLLFRRFANAHDGYGDVDVLRRYTVDDFAEFFHCRYTPGNAVVSVVGDHPTDEILELVQRQFGDIPARPCLPAPDVREPEPVADTWETCTEPGVPATAVAVGYRLPDPAADLPGYLAHLLLAQLVNRHGLGVPAVSAVSASCGLFGPFDARDPDALVITAVIPPNADPRQVTGALERRWEAWSDPAQVASAAAAARRRAATGHRRDHADPYARCRARGRMEILFGRPELVDTLPDLIAGVDPAQVAGAAGRLASAARAVLVMVPGPARTRPGSRAELPHAPAPAGSLPAPPPAPPPGSAQPRAMPPVRTATPPRLGPLSDARLAGGLRAVAVRDDRAPVVELRLRLPLGSVGWYHPHHATALARQLAGRTGAAAQAEELGGELRCTTDGQWLDVTGYVPAGAAAEWLALVGPLLTPPELGGPPAPAPGPVPVPETVGVDLALRRHWLSRAPGGPGPAPAPEVTDLGAVHRAMLAEGQGWLVAVGDLDPGQFLELVERAAQSWPLAAAPAAPASLLAPPPVDTVVVAGDHPAPEHPVRLGLSAPEPAGDDRDAAARYLATAVVGGYHQSRLLDRVIRQELTNDITVGRDVCLTVPRVYLRAELAAHGAVAAAAAAAALREELHRAVDSPVTGAELAQAQQYCAAQLLAAFDSPATKADAVRHSLSAGHGPHWLAALPRLLAEVDRFTADAAGRELFAAHRMTTIVIGPSEVARAVAGAWPGPGHAPGSSSLSSPAR